MHCYCSSGRSWCRHGRQSASSLNSKSHHPQCIRCNRLCYMFYGRASTTFFLNRKWTKLASIIYALRGRYDYQPVPMWNLEVCWRWQVVNEPDKLLVQTSPYACRWLSGLLKKHTIVRQCSMWNHALGKCSARLTYSFYTATPRSENLLLSCILTTSVAVAFMLSQQ